MSSKLIPLMFLIGCAGDGSAKDTGTEADPRAVLDAAIDGTWVSPCTPNPPDGYGNLSYFVATLTNDGPTASFSYELAGDVDCTYALATFRNESHGEIGEPLPQVEDGTWELNVFFDAVFATPHDPSFVSLFDGSGCGSAPWVAGVEQDVSQTGCLTFQPIVDCPADYDIVNLTGDELRSGRRDADMCTPTGRPTALNDWRFSRR